MGPSSTAADVILPQIYGIRRTKRQITAITPFISFKVINFDTNGKSICDVSEIWRIIGKFSPSTGVLVFNALVRGEPLNLWL